MRKKRILFVFQEISPYLPDSQMSNIGRCLPQGIQEAGKEIRTFMPRFGSVNERRNQLHEVIRLSGMNLIINENDHPLIIKVASIQQARMQVYFIDNEDYFGRKAILQDDSGKHFKDNDERAIFYARGVIETVNKLNWSPDIIHCHGWFTSLAAVYLKKVFNKNPLFANSKIVYSLYNNEFSDTLQSNFIKKIPMEGLDPGSLETIKKPTFANVNKLAIDHADAIVQNSETIDHTIIDYAKSTDKPFLEYHTEASYVEEVNRLYDKLLEK